ncbi:hypothetical protein AJ87_07565 [Rhizobium yanglingense]|nr:hypothetical protein AJ87_07565 [Rhizobium yanglingense]
MQHPIASYGHSVANHCHRHEHRLLRASLRGSSGGQTGFATPDIQQTSIEAPAPGNSRDVHVGFCASSRIRAFSASVQFRRWRRPVIASIRRYIPSFIHRFIHDSKHGINAISNHSLPLPSMKW